jgi:hypothetical protein
MEMAASVGSQAEVYERALGERYPWATSGRLAEAAGFLADVMQSDVLDQPSLSWDGLRFADEEIGARLASILGSPPKVG